MKRLGNIMNEQNVTESSCIAAIKAAVKNKPHSRRSAMIELVLENIKKYAKLLREMALNPHELFVPHDYKHKTIEEHGKTRELMIPDFWPDQCMHHLVIDLIRSYALPRIDPYAVACIEHRGIDYGVKALQSWIVYSNPATDCEPHTGLPYNELKRRDTCYYIQGDIVKCFPSLKSEIIMRELRSLIKDEKWLYIVESILSKSENLPIGISMSGWLLNITLRRFDERIRLEPGVTRYLRYMDDFILFSPHWRVLKEIQPKLRTWLKDYGLQPKPMEICLTDLNPPDIMGHQFLREYVIRRKTSWLAVSRDIARLEHFVTKYRLDIQRVEDLMFLYDSIPAYVLVGMRSRIGFSQKDRNSRLGKFLANRGYDTIFRNASRAFNDVPPVDIAGNLVPEEYLHYLRTQVWPLMKINIDNRIPVMTFVDRSTGKVVENVLRVEHPLNPRHDEYLAKHADRGIVPLEQVEKNVKEFYQQKELAKQRKIEEAKERRKASHAKYKERLQQKQEAYAASKGN